MLEDAFKTFEVEKDTEISSLKLSSLRFIERFKQKLNEKVTLEFVTELANEILL